MTKYLIYLDENKIYHSFKSNVIDELVHIMLLFGCIDVTDV